MVLVMDLQQAVNMVRGGRETSWNLWEMPKRTVPVITGASSSAKVDKNDVEPSIRNTELSTLETKNHKPGLKVSLQTILAAYGIASNIASQLDRNTQHALSLTCREIYETMRTSRALMARQSLRCCNDVVMQKPGKREVSSSCARDLVADCIKCSQPVCRNCIVKPRFVKYKENRYQRLCPTCAAAPLLDLQSELVPPPSPHTVAFDAFVIPPCKCEDISWVCASCGPRLLEKDRQYMTSWEWIRRYSESMEGIIEQGKIRCARGERCLAAETILVEVDSDAVDRAAPVSPRGSPPSTPLAHSPRSSTSLTLKNDEILPPTNGSILGSSLPNRGPGYFRQEIMGIGGVIKQKSWQNLTVGGLVTFFGDFFMSDRCGREGTILEKEKTRERRSWCGWCDRVIPAKKEALIEGGLDGNAREGSQGREATPCSDGSSHFSSTSGKGARSRETSSTSFTTHRQQQSQDSGAASSSSASSFDPYAQSNWSADYLDDRIFLDPSSSDGPDIPSASSPAGGSGGTVSGNHDRGGFYGFSEGSRSQRDLVNSLSDPQ